MEDGGWGKSKGFGEGGGAGKGYAERRSESVICDLIGSEDVSGVEGSLGGESF